MRDHGLFAVWFDSDHGLIISSIIAVRVGRSVRDKDAEQAHALLMSFKALSRFLLVAAISRSGLGSNSNIRYVLPVTASCTSGRLRKNHKDEWATAYSKGLSLVEIRIRTGLRMSDVDA